MAGKSRSQLRGSHAAPSVTAAPGYKPNGVSQFSRYAATSFKLSAHRPPKQRMTEGRTLTQLIDRHRDALAKMEKQLAGPLDDAKRTKLLKNLGIKRDFLTRLIIEFDEMLCSGANVGSDL